MNIWDSVQRGLEKASNEASRIAKTQRLRSSIDKLGQQIQENERGLVNSVMHLFYAGQLTQGELVPLCQQIALLQQQMTQLQGELQLVNMPQQPNAAPTTTTPQTPTQQVFTPANPYTAQTNPYATSASPEVSTPLPPTVASQASATDQLTPFATALSVPPPPPGMTDPFVTFPTTPAAPPPPPGVADPLAPVPSTVPQPTGENQAFTISSQETQLAPAEASAVSTRICSRCHTPAGPTGAFCQNCGAPLENGNPQQPTTLTENPVPSPSTDQATTEEDVP